MCSVFLTCQGTFGPDETNQRQWGPHKFKKNAPRLLFFFENHPFGRYWPFWIFWKGPLKSSLSLIGSIGYPDMWGVQNNLSLSHNHEKSVSRLPLLWKSPFLPFWRFLGHFWHSWRLLWNPNVSDWFNQYQKAPWHVRNPENIESLQKPWNKCVKAAILFEKTLFTLLALFWAAFDFDYGFFEVFTVSDLFHKLPMHVRSLEQL